jgi:hypothetical protein
MSGKRGVVVAAYPSCGDEHERAIKRMRASVTDPRQIRTPVPMGADECPAIASLCDGSVATVAQLCAMLADGGADWGDTGLSLYRRHAVAGCLLAIMRDLEVKMIYVIRDFRAVGRGCRKPLHTFLFDSVRGTVLRCVLDEVACGVDDFRRATQSIYYGKTDTAPVNNTVVEAISRLLAYAVVERTTSGARAVVARARAPVRPADGRLQGSHRHAAEPHARRVPRRLPEAGGGRAQTGGGRAQPQEGDRPQAVGHPRAKVTLVRPSLVCACSDESQADEWTLTSPTVMRCSRALMKSHRLLPPLSACTMENCLKCGARK